MDAGYRLALLTCRWQWQNLPGTNDMEPNDIRLSEHFTLGEMTRSYTAARMGIDNTPPDNLVGNLRDLCVQVLEPVRLHFGVPFRPSSGYRSRELNRAVGGAVMSQHCNGLAVDFEIPGVSNYDLAAWIRDNLVFDMLFLEHYTPGLPASGWVHVSYKAGSNSNRVMTYSNRAFQQGLVA